MAPLVTSEPNDVDHMLAAHDPAAQARLTREGVERALDHIGAAIASQPRRQSSAHRRRRLLVPRGLLLAGTILALVAASAVATKLLTAHTGQYAKGWQIRAGGPGEYLRMSAPDFCQAALKLSTDLPYPPGYSNWRPWVVVTELQVPRLTAAGDCGPHRQAPRTEVSSGAAHGFFAMSAFCAWVYDWRQAELNGNRASAAQAARVIAVAPHWKAVRAEDAHPSAAPPYTGPGQHGQMTTFGWFLPFRRAVLAGDRSLVSQLIAENYGTAGCSYFRPPPASHGGTVNPLAVRSS